MEPHPGKNRALALGALGVVFGDIGASPLYTMKEAFFGLHPLAVTEANVLGVLSLVFWSLTMVVSFKYVGFILRADNRGEGGIFALLSLLPQGRGLVSHGITLLALAGAALLYGDGVITPAISVLSAVEGLEVATSGLRPLVVPLTVGILLGLFAIQKRGTGGIGQVFGPVMLVWFLALSALGIGGIVRNPVVLAAVNPAHALHFFLEHGFHGFLALGSVVLCLTGAEALYADLGHFGRGPIRRAWFVVAFPALLLNYAGQGAVLLHDPAAGHPFYALVPDAILYAMVGLATVAAVIASQALIAGVFSLTRQATQLGFLPRIHIVHTSGEQKGQIYVPWANRFLGAACIGIVLMFQKSTGLAAAYGLAATGNMVITTAVFFLVARWHFRWSWAKTLPLVGTFLVFDLSFFGANLFKFVDGGWFPVLLATCVVVVMTTWREGRRMLGAEVAERSLPLDVFLEDVARVHPVRVRGTAVFMASSPVGTPPAMLHHFKHLGVLHEQVVILSAVATDRPVVPVAERIDLENLGQGFYRILAYYGFMETPNVGEVMELARSSGLESQEETTSLFLGRETILPSGRSKRVGGRKPLFLCLPKNAAPATAYFRIPPGRVVELGMQIEL
jgi:KUP system potassium uptake protein